MKIKSLLLLVAFVFSYQFTYSQSKYEWKQASAAGYTYKYVTNDPMQTRFYTLKNGMRVILSVNHKDPRVTAKIAVRAGSNNDPKDHTGLAHYLEHLLFKGTDKYGSLDWAKEKPLLDKIEDLYEVYNSTTDVAKRKEIYKEIDKVSGEASKYAIANEYDKLMSSIGSQGTNAHTSVEETVYEEDVPASSLNKYLLIQAERFRYPVFRIFHTELEAVYEEKNRGLDNDGKKMYEATNYYLFPTHNYGQQTTIGTIEHLKNPSIKAIRQFYNTYYVPNNMAIILSGDFNPDEAVKEIDKQFAYMQAKPVQEYKPAPEQPISAPIIHDIYGPSAESMRICYRTPAEGTHDVLMIDLISTILSNGKAGLLDLNLNKQQKLQSAGAGLNQFKDYGAFCLTGSPKQGQSLEEVKDLLMEQIEKLKKGDFDESLLEAVVANSKLGEIQGLEGNDNRAQALMTCFIQNKGEGWDKSVSWLDDEAKITKKQVVDFANTFFKNNYLILYKRKGEDKNSLKVEKPPITPVETNAGKQSAFVTMIKNMPSTPVKPQWMDFNKDIQHGKIGNASVLYTQNKDNQLYRVYYKFDMGSWNNKLLPFAFSYLSFLGTEKYTPEQISKAYYSIASNFNLAAGSDESMVTITGLQENFTKAVTMFEEIINNCKANDAALAAFKNRIMKSRSDAKSNKGAIMKGLTSYAVYGAKNPFNYSLTDQEIANITAEQLVDLLHNLMNYKHTIIYFGPESLSKFTTTLAGLHKMPATFKDCPAAVKFNRTSQTANQVLFANYDMVQSEINWVRNTSLFNAEKQPMIDLFNDYFGGGMGSIVFQTIRESKALAYSTYASYRTPSKKEEPYTISAYVGCQADKMKEAIKGMNELLNTLPQVNKSFEVAKVGEKNNIETSRITQDGVIFAYLNVQKKGLNYDPRKKEYEALDKISLDDITKFHQQELANKPYTYCIMASDKKVNMEDLKNIGDLKTLSLEEIFGY
ncbi:M16 family metallopeptidase [Solitalea koreensis]|uniref:Predicted Zn-dependent peptidase n=1 Tax=Solitalea koreensis TaxID=543615 RepID=A0A521EHF7_9SPHI|nr:M16 family metallopeptidase [Solitalea koreensis]SMO83349.1 Predicted Zn-dependent peptidase [Solitalea koreensis]